MSDNDIIPMKCPACGLWPVTFINKNTGTRSTRCYSQHCADGIAGIGKTTDESIAQWNIQVAAWLATVPK